MQKPKERIEGSIAQALLLASSGRAGLSVPRRLADAIHHAVNPGGARIRPTIVLSVAAACGDPMPQLANRAAAALELIHCASLVHDDLPCFDDADMRRGKPSVHKAYGEPLAVLAGDSLIVLAFKLLSDCRDCDAEQVLRLIGILSERTGMPFGICAGQGWESEPKVDLPSYHQAKTGALFIAATQMGAVSAGADPAPWEDLGSWVGQAFQLADDLHDALTPEDIMGKPSHQDERHGRPNAVQQFGLAGAVAQFDKIVGAAIASIPVCAGEEALVRMVSHTAEAIVPKTIRVAACG
ncbi:MAG: polyprenyl synthetase family protein [Alphaproteobacteria bacterium]